MNSRSSEGEERSDTPELTAEEITEQASKPDEDQIHRQMRRGDETKGDADDRDVAGALEYEETAHGWEERKHRTQKGEEIDER